MNWRSLIKTDTIEFLCAPEDYGIIPEPIPAAQSMPSWLKSLKPFDREARDPQDFPLPTIKRCMPFLDALSLGWIIPLHADVHITTTDDATGMTWRSQFYRNIFEEHQQAQIKGMMDTPYPAMKLLNPWLIKVPKGYSVLFIPPINRPPGLFMPLSGFVDCDKYPAIVNFPGVFTKTSMDETIPAGTPMVQVIPIKRSSMEQRVAAWSEDEAQEMNAIRRRQASRRGHYRLDLREKK